MNGVWPHHEWDLWHIIWTPIHGKMTIPVYWKIKKCLDHDIEPPPKSLGQKKMLVGPPESLFVFLRFWDPKIFRVTLMQFQSWLLRYSHLCWLYVICSKLHDHQAKLHSFLQLLSAGPWKDHFFHHPVGEYVFDISEVQAQGAYIFLDPHKILVSKFRVKSPPSAPESGLLFLLFSEVPWFQPMVSWYKP